MRVAGQLSSITTRMLLILSVAFLMIVLMAYWVIGAQGKPKIQQMSTSIIEESGNAAINSLMTNINQVDGLAQAASTLSGALPKQDALYEQAIGNLMRQTDKKIVGGGVWFDPTMYNPQLDRKSFVWTRDSSGVMQPNTIFNSEKLTPQAYYRDWWYTPAMYSRHDHCVWSRAYIDPVSKYPMMTCARAMFNSKNLAFDGVVSFNVVLTELDNIMATWQKKIGGYMFLVDLDNRFLTFPDKSLVTKITKNNPQGELINVDEFAHANPSFAPIAKSLDKVNQTLIADAIAKDKDRYEISAGTLVSTTNLNKIGDNEAKLLSALLLINADESMQLMGSHLVDTVALERDFKLNEAATAYVFRIPFTYWKMVIVEPNRQMMSVANTLSKQLVGYLLLGFLPILLLTALAFRHYFTKPLRQMAGKVGILGELIEQKKYTQLPQHKLPTSKVSEIETISKQTNELIDRVVENEGALAEINVHLEKKVAERTQALQQAMDTLKSSQVQLVRSEKMATLGQMVAGVAHEVNTPLGYVRSNIELVGDNLSRYDDLINNTEQLLACLNNPEATEQQRQDAIANTLACCDAIKEDELSEDLAELVKDGLFGVDQIAELVTNLRDFSRIDESKVKAVDINECVKSSLVMARSNLKSLEVITHLEALPEVECNPSQINQVLINLFNNAAQAIPEGIQGVLTITTKLADAAHIKIEVADNGLGISDTVLAKMFEPFFTTKKSGEGTGLGLAIATQIMEQHGGSISATSQQASADQPDAPSGTTFVLTLPISQANQQTPPKTKSLFTT